MADQILRLGFTLHVQPQEDDRLSSMYLHRLHACITDALYKEFGPGTEILIRLDKVENGRLSG